MKRSKKIQLLLLGGLSTAALTGCEQKPSLSTQNFYTNNFQVPGVGYYHAPFRAWYSLPYNHFDPAQQRYFYGGQWGATPFETVTNISQPTPQAAAVAEAQRTDISRGGFGHSYHHYGGWIHS